MKTLNLKFSAVLLALVFTTVFTSCEQDEQVAPIGADQSGVTAANVMVDPFGNKSSAPASLSQTDQLGAVNFVEPMFTNITSSVYTYGVGSQNTMKVFVSADNQLTDKPSVILFPGGGFTSYTREADLEALAFELAEKGYLAAVAKYSLSSDAVIDTDDWIYAVQDVRSSVRYLRSQAANLGLSTENIFIGGWSNGAQIAFNHGYMSYGEEVDIDNAFQSADVTNRVAVLGWDNNHNPGYSSDVKGVIAMNVMTQAEDFIDAGDPSLFLVGCTNQQFSNGVITYGTFTIGGITAYGPQPMSVRALSEGYVLGENLEFYTEQWPQGGFSHPNYTTIRPKYWTKISAFMARNMD